MPSGDPGEPGELLEGFPPCFDLLGVSHLSLSSQPALLPIGDSTTSLLGLFLGVPASLAFFSFRGVALLLLPLPPAPTEDVLGDRLPALACLVAGGSCNTPEAMREPMKAATRAAMISASQMVLALLASTWI